ncbi:MAG TPA: class I SAM-dependent methyltransferase [Vicinamibacterales bacterium]|jgi:SAM-dependent methyltransferase
MSETTYVLGCDPAELERLDQQAAFHEQPTRLLLARAGITRGMRVLDLGTGLGHVARLAGELTGPTGAVVGLDRTPVLAVARQRAEAAGEHHVTFVEGDLTEWRSPEPFDAIVGRLVLFHVADPVVAVRHQLNNLRPGGLFVALDFDIGASRTEPAVPIAAEAVGWIDRAFSAAGASPRIGARLGPILSAAGLSNVATVGIQGYIPPNDPVGAVLLSGVVRSMAGEIVRRGIATTEQIGLETLYQRIADAVRDADAVFLPPSLVGAWGTYQPTARA